MVLKRAESGRLSGDIQPRTEDGEPIASVHQLTSRIADLLDGTIGSVAVQGEISQWTVAASGHTYFTMKDDRAVLSAVLWRGRPMKHRIEVGMNVVARGRIAVYAPRGQYQLDCQTIAPVGIGDLQLRFDALKQRLAAEGMFDANRKRPLPAFPRRIGLATSRTGAAIKDILTTLERRMPSVEVVIRPALVQGSTAAADISAAIDQLNNYPGIDVIIVGRGGGSIEDLWAFNDEAVARAIARSHVPVVSAVGHETDFTIADFVADLRAATPTAAAELVVRDRAELVSMLRISVQRLSRMLGAKLDRNRTRLDALVSSRGLSRPVDIIRSLSQRIDDLEHRSRQASRRMSARLRGLLDPLDASLRALNPHSVLARGYACVEHQGRLVSRASDLTAGDLITLHLFDGDRKATIVDESKPGASNEP